MTLSDAPFAPPADHDVAAVPAGRVHVAWWRAIGGGMVVASAGHLPLALTVLVTDGDLGASAAISLGALGVLATVVVGWAAGRDLRDGVAAGWAWGALAGR